MASKLRSASTAEEKEEKRAGGVVCENGAEDCGGTAKDGKAKQKTERKKVRTGGDSGPKDGKDNETVDDEQKETVLCSCGKPVKNDSNGGVECDICGDWFHPKCELLNKEAYAAVETHKLFWMCSSCKSFLDAFRGIVKGKKVPSSGSESSEKAPQGDHVEKKDLRNE